MTERGGLGGGHRQMVVDQATAEAILERLGWTFHRIRGSAFYRDPNAALSGLWDHLENLGTQPTIPGDLPGVVNAAAGWPA